jgi:hypothetical protein
MSSFGPEPKSPTRKTKFPTFEGFTFNMTSELKLLQKITCYSSKKSLKA